MKPSKVARMALMLAAVVLLAGAGVRAQGDAGGPPPPGSGRHMGPGPHPLDDIGFLAFEGGLGGKTVTGAPFSASISTQSTQALSDGNQIQRSTTGSIARDSQGRTRRDMTLPPIGPLATVVGKNPPHAVFISDPVAGTNYVLHPDEKTAEQMPHVAWHGKGGKGPGPASNGRFANETTTTDLGTQNVNGISAQGTRTVRTIPAGEIGNAKPIVITTERWYSPELQVNVMIKRSDPTMGDVVYQLTNIQKQEPEASLFQVPSDYTVSQHGPRGAARAGGPAVPSQQ
jgi:hypothetical protein